MAGDFYLYLHFPQMKPNFTIKTWTLIILQYSVVLKFYFFVFNMQFKQ